MVTLAVFVFEPGFLLIFCNYFIDKVVKKMLIYFYAQGRLMKKCEVLKTK